MSECSKYFDDYTCWLFGEQSLPFGLLDSKREVGTNSSFMSSTISSVTVLPFFH